MFLKIMTFYRIFAFLTKNGNSKFDKTEKDFTINRVKTFEEIFRTFFRVLVFKDFSFYHFLIKFFIWIWWVLVYVFKYLKITKKLP